MAQPATTKKTKSSAVETLEITANKPLFTEIMNVAPTLEDDMRLGKLYSIEEVFSEE
jgi:hypothetical protein